MGAARSLMFAGSAKLVVLFFVALVSVGSVPFPSVATAEPSIDPAVKPDPTTQPDAGDLPVVYLTFDGGPGPRTQEFLDLLDSWDATATFFITGSHTYADPDGLRSIVAAGHVLATHTWDHPDLTTVSEGEVAIQFGLTNAIVRDITGISMTCWRPPFGMSNELVEKVAAAHGMPNSGWMANGRWDVDTIDWMFSYDFVLDRLNTITAGDVVLMHGGMNPDVGDMAALSTWLDENGDDYRFEALPDCGPPLGLVPDQLAFTAAAAPSSPSQTAEGFYNFHATAALLNLVERGQARPNG